MPDDRRFQITGTQLQDFFLRSSAEKIAQVIADKSFFGSLVAYTIIGNLMRVMSLNGQQNKLEEVVNKTTVSGLLLNGMGSVSAVTELSEVIFYVNEQVFQAVMKNSLINQPIE